MQSNNLTTPSIRSLLRSILGMSVLVVILFLGIHEYLNFSEYFDVQRLQNQAANMEQGKDYADMLLLGQQCQSAHPKNPAGYFISGKAHYYRRELTAALHDLKVADRLAPEFHTTMQQWIQQVEREDSGK